MATTKSVETPPEDMTETQEENWLTAKAKEYLDKKYGIPEPDEAKKFGARIAGGAKDKWYQEKSFENRFIYYYNNKGERTTDPNTFSSYIKPPEKLTILCWNANGLVTKGMKHNIIKHKFGGKADVILLSETHRMDVKDIMPEGYTAYCFPTILGVSGRPQRGLVIFCRTDTVGGNMKFASYFPDNRNPKMEYIALDFRVGKSNDVHRVVLTYCDGSFEKKNITSVLENVVVNAQNEAMFVHILGDINVPRKIANSIVKGMFLLLKENWPTNKHGNQIDHILSKMISNEQNPEESLRKYVKAHKPFNPYGDKKANDHLVLWMEIGNDINKTKHFFCVDKSCCSD